MTRLPIRTLRGVRDRVGLTLAIALLVVVGMDTTATDARPSDTTVQAAAPTFDPSSTGAVLTAGPVSTRGWPAATPPVGGALGTVEPTALLVDPPISSDSALGDDGDGDGDGFGQAGRASDDPAADAPPLAPVTAEAAAEPAVPASPGLLDQPDPAIVLGPARAAATTGVPDGMPLTPLTGEIRVRTPGQVIDGIDLTGCLVIEASNVVVRNSRVSCRNPTRPSAVHVLAGNWNLLIEDSEIDGLGGADIGIGWNNYTLRRVEIRNVADGAKAGSNVVIEDSWIHDIVRKGDLHPDAIQSTGGRNIVIARNYLDPAPTGAGDVRNSAIQLGSENGDGLSDVLIENNVLLGGNYTVNVRGDTVVQNVVVRGNTFVGPRRYGPIQAPPSVVFEENIDLVAAGGPARVRLVYS